MAEWLGGYTTSSMSARASCSRPPSVSIERRIFQHELTHRFVHYFIPASPVWLNEGMACFYETMSVVHGEAIIGESKFHFVRGLTAPAALIDIEDLPRASTLLAMRPEQFYAKNSRRCDRSYRGIVDARQQCSSRVPRPTARVSGRMSAR